MPKKAAVPRRGAVRKKEAVEKEEPVEKKEPVARRKAVARKSAERKDAVAKMESAAMDELMPVEIEVAEDEGDARPGRRTGNAKLIQLLNDSLAWELRAQAMYAHYAAYVKGLESLTLAGHFEGEVTESLGHAKCVRDIIAALGGEAVTTRDPAAIIHTEDTRVMLEEALKTESEAAAAYRKIIPLVKSNPVSYHAIYHILKDETAAVIEVETLLGS